MCVCMCVCVCVWVGGCGYVMQDISKFKNLINLERVAAGHQKATESEIWPYIGNTLKI